MTDEQNWYKAKEVGIHGGASMTEKLVALIEEYGEACKQHGIAIGKEKGFVAAAERVYLAHKALMDALGAEDNDVPPYSLNVQPWEKRFGL